MVITATIKMDLEVLDSNATKITKNLFTPTVKKLKTKGYLTNLEHR